MGSARDNDALESVRWHWGEAYEIDLVEGVWRARRLDGLGEWTTAPNADKLSDEILLDYLQQPVLRPPEEQ